MNDTNGDSSTSYGIAAVLVLLPLSYILDSFFSKKEPAKKVGAEIWVMVIHAVIFALFGIGALITGVISLVVLFTSSGGSEAAQTALISSLIITAFYALTFLRTLNPASFRWIQGKYKMIMLLTVGVIAVLGLVGPVAKDRATRDDRLITGNISAVSSAVSDYARTNKKLPADLKVLELRGDARQLVDRNLVEYKAEANVVPATIRDATRGVAVSDINNLSSPASTTPTFRYQLCVNYKKELNNRGSSYGGYDGYDKDTDGYTSYLSVYDHPAGNICYKLKTSDY